VTPPSLAGVIAKLERAQEHLDALEHEARVFVHSNPYRLVFQFNHETGWHDGHVRVIRDPPLRLATILGDAIQNARASLDHLIVQLVIANGEKPIRPNAFPIHKDVRAFINGVGRYGRNPRRTRYSPLRGVDRESWALIERLQPYMRRERAEVHPLAVLNELSRIDKHEILHAVALSLAPEVPDLRFTGPDDRPDIIEAKFVPGVRFEHDAVVLRLRVHGPDPDPEMQMHGELPMEIRFGERLLRRDDVQRLRDVAADVVVQLGTPLGLLPTS
jgi:hypothetical protein